MPRYPILKALVYMLESYGKSQVGYPLRKSQMTNV